MKITKTKFFSRLFCPAVFLLSFLLRKNAPGAGGEVAVG